MMVNCWLPELELNSNYNGKWIDYENILYEIFKSDFIESNPLFDNKKVVIRREPYINGKEEAFYHITCQDYCHDNNREPDLRRCERIRWVRSFIENYSRCDPSLCMNCTGIKIWSEPYGKHSRVYLLLEEQKYIVIVENRMNYNLLITAFYIGQEHYMRKLLKRYQHHRTT